ncbi:RNA recognition motif. (a.k.a. RRM, RBD, or RNP domain) [Filimonas lacunae]|uniref:RNA recognition motif. (A.k.a. RRM, RBD, or RNP domain) n=1 Tax=Filimonas lacunae TaxID=477680 RepID=A0A173MGI5_9BACT|nr:RNA-binding protein [Filimonas lacunae]BAV06587.1 hypothetical protein FLA_2606 [Filimonas lacunae]SIT27486.1 RNA recognition motif. (a.k.a. RRM, RBD, or RNP domain) [Filimonas lacunae]
MRLSVSSLPPDFDKYDLQRLFAPFGWVAYSKIFYDPITLKSTRKGVVEFREDRQAIAAMEGLQGKMVGQHPLNIKEKKARPFNDDNSNNNYDNNNNYR